MTAPLPFPRDVTCAMSVDVEDFFQVQALSGAVSRADWDSFVPRVGNSTRLVLDVLGDAGVRSTMFVLGWVAERDPGLVRRIVSDGHELASHGYWHERVDSLSCGGFALDVAAARAALEDAGGVRVLGYRAPTFSIGRRSTPWAHGVLADAGHAYSSSTYPVAHDIYGDPDAEERPHLVAGGRLLEVPMAVSAVRGRRRPVCGGGWFRLLPYRASAARLDAFLAGGSGPAVFYTHPWEFDPGQPRVAGIGLRSRVRHYVGLSRTEGRFRRLLRDFRWDTMAAVFGGEMPGARGGGGGAG